MTAPETPPQPLAGLLVVSLEQAVAAPYCSSRLADAGARVIKVERPEGDFARHYDQAAGGVSSYFAWINRGKQSLTADIKAPEDNALLQRIVQRADVFIQNLAPGAAARAGFDSRVLRERNPGLITVDISGYGRDNAYADMKAYDLLVQAESGLASITGHAAGPGRVGVSVCDIACGMYAHTAVLEALLARATSGRGRGIEVSLFDAVADWMTVPLLYFEGTGLLPQRLGLAHPTICPYGAFATADDHLVLLSIQNEREWHALCEGVLGQPDLPATPGFRNNAERVNNRDTVDGVVARCLAGLERQRAAALLQSNRIAFGFVNSVADLVHHPALRRVTVRQPGGELSLVAPAARHSECGPELGAIPELGEHNGIIRAEFNIS